MTAEVGVDADRHGRLARLRRGLDRELPWPAYLAALALIGWNVGVRVATRNVAILDRTQQYALVEALAGGHLRAALRATRSAQASPPGFGLFALPFRLLAPAIGPMTAYVVAGWAALIVLGVGVVVLGRTLGLQPRSGREVLGVAAVIASPITLECLTEAYHPVDLLTVGLIMLGTAAFLRHRMGWTAMAFAGSLLCKQWSLIPLAVLVAGSPPADRIRVGVPPLLLTAALLVPFALANPSATLQAVSAPGVRPTSRSVLSHLALSDQAVSLEARLLPLALVAVALIRLIDRQRALGPRLRLPTPVLMAALVATAFLRPLLDPAGYLYYYLPGWGWLSLLDARWRWPLLSLAGTWAMERVLDGRSDGPHLYTPRPIGHAALGQGIALTAFLVSVGMLAHAVRRASRDVPLGRHAGL